jgi:hypothetical protein
MTDANATPGTTETPAAPVETPAPETPTPEQEQENEKAFAEGFDNAGSEEPPAPPPAKDKTPETPAAPKEEPKPELTPETPAAKMLAGKTEAEIQELLDKVPGLEQRLVSEIQKVYGKFGEIQRLLQSVKPGQAAPKLKKGALKRITAEYPEIAQMLEEDLLSPEAWETPTAEAPRSEPTPTPTPTATPDEIEARINQHVEARLLSFQHPDWKTLSKEKEFDEFLKALPGKTVPVQMNNGVVVNYPETAKQYIESDDAQVTSECFTKYKSWKAARQQKTTQNKERLEGALTPKGGSAVPEATLDDEAAFIAGFNGTG